MKFEDKIKKIDQIIEQLQNPDIELGEAKALYETGVKLSEECKEELESIKLSITTIDGKPVEL